MLRVPSGKEDQAVAGIQRRGHLCDRVLLALLRQALDQHRLEHIFAEEAPEPALAPVIGAGDGPRAVAQARGAARTRSARNRRGWRDWRNRCAAAFEGSAPRQSGGRRSRPREGGDGIGCEGFEEGQGLITSDEGPPPLEPSASDSQADGVLPREKEEYSASPLGEAVSLSLTDEGETPGRASPSSVRLRRTPSPEGEGRTSRFSLGRSCQAEPD